MMVSCEREHGGPGGSWRTKRQAGWRRRGPIAAAVRAVCLAAIGVLAACAPKLDAWPSGPAAKEVTAARTLHYHAVAFSQEDATLMPTEARRLAQFIGDIGSDPREPVLVLYKEMTDPALSGQRLVAIRRVLEEMGMVVIPTPSGVDAKTRWLPPVQPDEILIQASRYDPVLPDCPDFSRPRIGDFVNRTSSNFGCANAVNLGAMIAEPRDLVIGSDPGSADGVRGAAAIRRYRAGEEPRPVFRGTTEGR